VIAWTRRSELELDPAINRNLGAGTEVTMIRRRFEQTQSLEERLAEEAKRLQEDAQLGKPGRQRPVLTSAIGCARRVCSRQGKGPCRT
jgi:hypothetical protein